jgi:hypothetical protein
MSVERIERQDEVVWRVRWRDARGRNRSRVLGRKKDAQAFDAEIKRRKRIGDLATLDAGRETLDEYVTGPWATAHAAHLSPRTRQNYASMYDCHIAPRLGGVPLREIDPELIAAFQGDMLRKGVGHSSIRKSMTLLGAILQRAAESRRVPYNPQRVVRKARGCRWLRRSGRSHPSAWRRCVRRRICATRRSSRCSPTRAFVPASSASCAGARCASAPS